MIPLPTTTISVLRLSDDPTRDDMDRPADSSFAVVASGVRATIGSGQGRAEFGGGARQEVTFRLGCDPVDAGVRFTDHVLDETTGVTYQVIVAMLRTGLGVDHIEGDLQLVTGEV